MKVTVDRIENKIAVLLIRPKEDYDIKLPVKYLPEEVKEGSILDIDFKIMQKETEAAEKRVRSLLDKLQNKNSENR
ncbi:MAG: DUF3006 domain-containing protein [Halanaerobiales bacterium]